MSWVPENFFIATPTGPVMVAGYTLNGLGIHGGPKRWNVTHLNTGHLVCTLKGRVRTSFPVATELAGCADWDFDGLTGWKNRDPEIGTKVSAICRSHSKVADLGEHPEGCGDHEVAKKVLEQRSNGN